METHNTHGFFQSVNLGLMCMLLCGIHYLLHVDASNLSTLVANLAFLQWKSMSVRCDPVFDHAILPLRLLMVRWYSPIRTPFVICKLLGMILRYLPWNVCIKMYLRIGEAKNPGPTSKPQPIPQPKQPDANRRMFQTVQFATANVVSMVDKAPWFNSFDHE